MATLVLLYLLANVSVEDVYAFFHAVIAYGRTSHASGSLVVAAALLLLCGVYAVNRRVRLLE